MKTRKIIKGMMAVAIVAVAGLAIFANQPKEKKSDVMLANIEALAGCETAKNVTSYMKLLIENGCVCLHCSEPNTPECRCKP